MRIQDILSTRSWCAACVEGRCVGGQHRIELLEEEEREKTTPIVAFDDDFLTQENTDTFPILICRDSRCGQTGATCCERKGPTARSIAASSISFLVGFIKDLGFRRVIVKCDNKPSTNALQDAVIHACAGVEVIPQGPPEGDRMANGRVEMALREVGRQCGTLRIYAEQNTSVRFSDDSPLLSWLLRFAAQVMNKMRIGKDGKRSEAKERVKTARAKSKENPKEPKFEPRCQRLTQGGLENSKSEASSDIQESAPLTLPGTMAGMGRME